MKDDTIMVAILGSLRKTLWYAVFAAHPKTWTKFFFFENRQLQRTRAAKFCQQKFYNVKYIVSSTKSD